MSPERGPEAPTGNELRRRLVEAGRRLYEAGLIAGTAGNLSVRRSDGSVLVTPRGVRKDQLDPDDLLVLDLEAPDEATAGRATTEWPVHRACYRVTGRTGAVVHTHAPSLTALGLRHGGAAGGVLAERLPEIDEAVGGVAVVSFAPSGSAELGEAVARKVAEDVGLLLLTRHGAVSVGEDLRVAVDRMELAELAARAVLAAG